MPLFSRRRLLTTFRRGIRTLGWGAILLSLCSGVSTLRHPRRQDPGQGWLDVKTLLMFSLATPDLPASRDALTSSLTAALRNGMTLDPAKTSVLIKGKNPAHLSSVSIDISNARPDLTKKPSKLNENIPARPGLFVRQFQMTAHPLFLGRAAVQYDLSATDAKLDLFQTNDARPLLMMVNAKSAHVDLTAPIADLQDFVTDQAKSIAKGAGFLVRSVRFGLESQSEHSVAVSIRVNFSVGVVNLKGRMDIDEDMNAKASNLYCVGQGPVGLVVAQMLEPSIKEYEGRIRPLMEFPQRQMKLHDVRIKVDQSVHITADFGDPDQPN